VLIDQMAKRMEAERKAAEVQIGKQIADFKSAVVSGSPWAGNVARLGAAVWGTEHEAQSTRPTSYRCSAIQASSYSSIR
jgi:hypothetical protein